MHIRSGAFCRFLFSHSGEANNTCSTSDLSICHHFSSFFGKTKHPCNCSGIFGRMSSSKGKVVAGSKGKVVAGSKGKAVADTRGGYGLFEPGVYTVDTADPIRDYFGLGMDEEADNLLLVSIKKIKGSPPPDKVYVATAATKLLIGNTNFKVSCTALGDIYVVTNSVADAAKLDGQDFAAFGGKVHFDRFEFVNPEVLDIKKLEQATFKIFES